MYGHAWCSKDGSSDHNELYAWVHEEYGQDEGGVSELVEQEINKKVSMGALDRHGV